MFEIICTIIMCLILIATIIMMIPLVVDTLRNEIDLIKQEKKRKRKRDKHKTFFHDDCMRDYVRSVSDGKESENRTDH